MITRETHPNETIKPGVWISAKLHPLKAGHGLTQIICGNAIPEISQDSSSIWHRESQMLEEALVESIVTSDISMISRRQSRSSTLCTTST